MDDNTLNVKLPKDLTHALNIVSEHTGVSKNEIVILSLVSFLSDPGRISRTDDSMNISKGRDKYLH